jgi:uncharacterized protein (TIGR02996 family)
MSYHEHPDWPPLLAAVCSAPADSLPRLVAADWLDEHGYHDRKRRLACHPICDAGRIA